MQYSAGNIRVGSAGLPGAAPACGARQNKHNQLRRKLIAWLALKWLQLAEPGRPKRETTWQKTGRGRLLGTSLATWQTQALYAERVLSSLSFPRYQPALLRTGELASESGGQHARLLPLLLLYRADHTRKPLAVRHKKRTSTGRPLFHNQNT